MGLSPSPNSKRNIITLISIVGLVFIATIFGFYYINKTPTTQPPASTNQVQKTGLNILNYLKTNKAALSVPPTKNKPQAIEFSQLPESVQAIIIANHSDFYAEEVLYENDKKGFKINYSLPMSIEDTYRSNRILIKSLGWNVLGGQRANLASMFEAENVVYQARIEGIKIDDNNTNVTTTIIGI